MEHVLVIGGTGMLSEVSVWLAEQGYHVSVIGRNPQKMQRLTERSSRHIHPVLVDYTDSEKLMRHLSRIQQTNGPVHSVIAWVHSVGHEVIPCLVDSLPQDRGWKLFHVNGSRSNLEKVKAEIPLPEHVRYFQIQLGFKVENGKQRWLTHEEISAGVIKAVQEEKAQLLVGTLTP